MFTTQFNFQLELNMERKVRAQAYKRDEKRKNTVDLSATPR